MTQEEKQLVLKDLCARLPHGVICRANEINLDGELLFINKIYNIVALYNDKATGKFDACPIDDVKPSLRPMSSMTEEEMISYYGKKMIIGQIKDGHTTYIPEYNTLDWLLAHHFDFRGLITMGLALEAPEDMYIMVSNTGEK